MVRDGEAALAGEPLLAAEFEEKPRERPTGSRGTIRRSIDIAARILPPLSILKPSFLTRHSIPIQPHPTAWLDGIRGYASFCVFIYHFQHLFHKSYVLGFASNDGKNDHWIIQLPIIRLIFTGAPMVSIFWVLSGVSLTLKPLQLARSQTWDKLLDTMFSSIFRRMLRLYIPVLVVQFFVLLATLFGLYDHAFALGKDWPFAGTNEKQHTKQDGKLEQIKDWVSCMWEMANPFAPSRPRYDVHLWTIPLEFRNSMILFVVLVGLAKLRARIRIVLVIGLCMYLFVIEQGDVALFIAGMGCAELLLIRDESVSSLPSTEGPHLEERGKPRKFAPVLWGIVLLAGLHLLSWPVGRYRHALGYQTLSALTPHFIGQPGITWTRIGASITLLAFCGSEYLRAPFSTRFAIYLGKISFPLYIIHGPVNHIVGYWLVPTVWKFTGDSTLFQYEVGVVLAFAMEAVVVVWLADIVMRTVDKPSVRLGRSLQARWSV